MVSAGQIITTNKLHAGINNIPFHQFKLGIFVVVAFDDSEKLLGTRVIVKL